MATPSVHGADLDGGSSKETIGKDALQRIWIAWATLDDQRAEE